MSYFPGKSRLTAEFKGTFNTVCEEVAFDIEVLGMFNEWSNFGR
jgi:hypothetical protein